MKRIVESVVDSRIHVDDIYQHPFFAVCHILIHTNYFGMFDCAYRQPDKFFFPLSHFVKSQRVCFFFLNFNLSLAISNAATNHVIKLMTQFVIYLEFFSSSLA